MRTLTIKDYQTLDFSTLKDLTVLYCRLSNEDDRDGESNSISTQKRLLEEVVRQENLPNPVLFVDDGFSGTTLKRPAIQEALRLVESGKVSTFVVKDLSRLSRSNLDVLQLTELTFPAYDVRFIARGDNIDSLKQTDSDASFIQLKAMFNDFYARDTSKKIRAAKLAKARAGEHSSSHVPYGYMKDPSNPKQWVTNPETAPVVKRIFETVKTGLPLTTLAKQLEDDKILTPSAYRFFNGEKLTNLSPLIAQNPYAWNACTISSMLTREDYLGHTVNLKIRIKSYKDKRAVKIPRDQQLIFENTHEAIIDQQTFDTVQKIRQHRRVVPKHDYSTHANLFAGLVFCGTCGTKHRFTPQKKGDLILDHYKCGKYSQRFEPCDNPHYIRKVVLEELVKSDLNALLSDFHFDREQFLAKLQQQYQLEQEEQIKQVRKELATAQHRHQTIDRIIQRAYEDLALGKITEERFSTLNQTYEAEQKELSQKIQDLDDQLTKQNEASQNLSKFLERIESFTTISDLTIEMVNQLLDKIVIHHPIGKGINRQIKVSIYYNFIGQYDKSSD